MSEVDLEKVAEHVRCCLSLLGENVERPGLVETPKRVAKMWTEMFWGLDSEPPEMKCFPKEKNDEIVIVRDIAFASMCEHHLLPFFGKVHVGYLPKDKVVGLSKFGRIVDHFAARPQIQEQMTRQIADHVFETVKAEGVIVVVSAVHTCMSIRGVKKAEAITVTSAIAGDIDKGEFFEMLKLEPR